MKLSVEQLQPIGTKRARGLAQLYQKGRGRYHETIEVDLPVFPDDMKQAGQQLRTHRVSRSLTMMDAARAFELSVSVVSGMEHGEYRFDIEEAKKRLDAYERPPR